MTENPLSSALPTLPPKEEAKFVILSLRGKRSDEANSREGEFPCHCEPQARQSHRRTDGHILLTLVVGYFAYAQYDDRG